MELDGLVWHVQSLVLEVFIAEVRKAVAKEPDAARRVQLLRPAFSRLLGDKEWLPVTFTQPDASGGMGAGVGNYLIHRSATRDISLMSLVLPANVSTPVHDHLAWGLVGLYQGEQEEWVYRLDGKNDEDRADLILTEHRRLRAGDFYELLPPEGDIHQVRTVGDQPSVSLHLLGSDVGCTWRHRFVPDEHRVYPFRSGYSNEPCGEL